MDRETGLICGELEREDLDSGRLVARARAGDRDAFNRLYLRYFDRVYTHLRIVLQDEHEAEDAAQEVFLRVLRVLPRYRQGDKPFRFWLFRIVRNYSVSVLRKRARLEVEDPAAVERHRENGDGATMLEIETLDWLTDSDLVLLIEHMPLAQRQVVILRYMLDLGIEEIAGLMGRTPSAVTQLHMRAVRFLRKRLASLGRRNASDAPRSAMRSPRRQLLVVRERRFALGPPR